ncbi:MAG: hypothetical protein M3R24_20720 [Chloroflexota bacterium]|nr:hypothetical protein [Chloroflexota bacterium]PLS78051.1 MAG: hypothetical protein CYG59_20590 [Chloroflexota bacterium]
MITHEVAPEAQCIPRFPVLALLHPREKTRLFILWLGLGVAGGMGVMRLFVLPSWSVTALVLGLLLVPALQKWRSDAHRWGHTVMVLSVLLAAQAFHSLEHAVQMFQYHVLHWPPFASSGLISAANAEWVHFLWNWGVVAVVGYLAWNGMRNVWAWLLLGWALAHAAEHSYMLVRYLGLAHELQQLGFPQISAQGLPGVLGRDGWLARSTTTQGTFVCRLPGLTTASRIDVHFWWNTGEIVALLLAAHTFLRSHLSQLHAHSAQAH